jgi:hypothetical protein
MPAKAMPPIDKAEVVPAPQEKSPGVIEVQASGSPVYLSFE